MTFDDLLRRLHFEQTEVKDPRAPLDTFWREIDGDASASISHIGSGRVQLGVYTQRQYGATCTVRIAGNWVGEVSLDEVRRAIAAKRFIEMPATL